MTENKRLKALQLMRDELETPSRDVRLLAQCVGCKDEVFTICEWLRKTVEREIELETLFDGLDITFEGR